MAHETRTGNQFSREQVLHKGAGVDFAPPTNTPEGETTGRGRERWITEEEIRRNELFEENEKIYFGIHSADEGGPFRHPYDAQKKLQERIPYLGVNVMGQATDDWCPLVLCEEFRINSNDPQIAALLNPKDPDEENKDGDDDKTDEASAANAFSQIIEDSVRQTSYKGWVGIQPHVEIEKNAQGVEEKKLKVSLISPSNLRINEFPARDAIESIEKFTRWDDPEATNDPTAPPQHANLEPPRAGEALDQIELIGGEDASSREILLVERHFKGRFETQLFRIQGPWIIEELALPWFTENIDSSIVLEAEGKTGLSDFQITILGNKRVNRKWISDFTQPAKTLQKAINNRFTQENRILDIHSSPRLILPKNAARKDPETGQWSVDLQGKEVLFIDGDSGQILPQYLTWDGELEAARKQKLSLIQAILTELKIDPSLTAFSDLVDATVADTASKRKLTLMKTLKEAGRKRRKASGLL